MFDETWTRAWRQGREDGIMAICVKRYIHPLDSNGMAAIETKSVFGLVTSVVMELLHVSIVRKFLAGTSIICVISPLVTFSFLIEELS